MMRLDKAQLVAAIKQIPHDWSCSLPDPAPDESLAALDRLIRALESDVPCGADCNAVTVDECDNCELKDAWKHAEGVLVRARLREGANDA